jgi:hypothetical protein
MNGWKVIGLRRPVYLVPVVLVAVLALIVAAAPREAWVQDDDACSSRGGPAVQLPATKLIIEHNATDQDTGLHGFFDGVNWTKLCINDPHGVQILVVEPKGSFESSPSAGYFLNRQSLRIRRFQSQNS